jgi:hypothetical protein
MSVTTVGAHLQPGGPSTTGWPILRSLIAKGGVFALRANRFLFLATTFSRCFGRGAAPQVEQYLWL